jgi:hypothetical protein
MNPGNWRRSMHERSTDNGGREGTQEVHSQSEAGDSEGMGCHWKWGGGLSTPWDSSPDPVSLEEEVGTGSCGIPEGNPVQTKSRGQGTPKMIGLQLYIYLVCYAGTMLWLVRDIIANFNRQTGHR